MIRLNVRFSDDVLASLCEVSRVTGLSMSAIVRKILEKAVPAQENPQKRYQRRYS
jgi:hypothetical protein